MKKMRYTFISIFKWFSLFCFLFAFIFFFSSNLDAQVVSTTTSPQHRHPVNCTSNRTEQISLSGTGSWADANKGEAFQWAKRMCSRDMRRIFDPNEEMKAKKLVCAGCPPGFVGCIPRYSVTTYGGKITYTPDDMDSACEQQPDGKWKCSVSCEAKKAKVKLRCGGCAEDKCNDNTESPPPHGFNQ